MDLRDHSTNTNLYFHIDLYGNRIYQNTYRYAGDFKEGIACVCLENGKYTHIDTSGNYLHSQEYELLDVYHKGFARAKDKDGWFHIDRKGFAINKARYSTLEPFYNGYAFAVTLRGNQITLSESGVESILF